MRKKTGVAPVFFVAYWSGGVANNLTLVMIRNKRQSEENDMKIAIAADHGGFELKQKLIAHYSSLGVEMSDLGTYSAESVDYPDYAEKVSRAVLDGAADSGVLICGTGIGISIAANRHKGIRAALLYSAETARLAREHNNANVAVFGARTMTYDEVVERLDIFLKTPFEGGRHVRRIEKIDVYGGC